MIQSKDISIIVQGPVFKDGITDKVIDNLRKHFPDSEIIISTWDDFDIQNDKADLIIKQKDPGARRLSEYTNATYSYDRQIVSTIAGLKKATRKYALKMRSDMYFLNANFLKYYNKFKKRGKDYNILNERVIISTSFAPNPKRGEAKPYHPSDWFFFGLTNDLIKIFDSETIKDESVYDYFKYHKRPIVKYDGQSQAQGLTRYAAEQYIWIQFLKRYIDLDFEHIYDIKKGNIEKSEEIFANNVIMLDLVQIEYRSFKKDKLEEFYTTFMYTHNEWLKMYKKYCDKFYILPLIDKEKFRRLFISIKKHIGVKQDIRAIFNYEPKNPVREI